MKRTILFLLFSVVVLHFAAAQIGGSSTYTFLTLPNAARVAALGGDVISITDNDFNFVFHNPALLNETMNKSIVLNYVNYFSDIDFGYAAYAFHIKKLGTFGAGLHFINYGTFEDADVTGEITGNFYAEEYALNLYWAREITERISLGVNLKPVLSQLERYKSYGVAADLGLIYKSKDSLFAIGLVCKNIGTQIESYYGNNREPLPFEIQLGISKKLKHAPFRITLLAQHLESLDMTFENPLYPTTTIDQFTGEVSTQSNFEKFTDKTFRHIVVGLEFVPSKNFHVEVAYNHQRRAEMNLPSKPAAIGISWGFGVRISKFHLSYGRASYHLAGASNHFSVTTNISDFKRGATL